jgi:Leucine-rich repeat (LRR) protein
MITFKKISLIALGIVLLVPNLSKCLEKGIPAAWFPLFSMATPSIRHYIRNKPDALVQRMSPIMFNFSGMNLHDLDGLAQIEQLAKAKNINVAQVHALSLSNNKLKDLGVSNFALFTHLKELDIDNNQLATFLPDAFNGLNNLEVLLLYKNHITNLHGGPFSKLRKLKQLGLSHNRIAQLTPDSFAGLARLETLQLDHNDLNQVSPQAITPLRHLKILNLKGNNLSEQNKKALKEALPHVEIIF